MRVLLEIIGNNAAIKVTSEDLGGVIYIFRREDIDAIYALNIIPAIPICYILYHDYYDRNINKNELYIGQTDTGMIRIKEHHKNKLGWNKGVLICYENPSYDIIFKLEGDLIKLAKRSLKYHATNIRNEDRGYLCNCQEKQYDKFLTDFKSIMSFINIDIFDINVDGAFIHDKETNLKAKIIKNTTPYEIEILPGSYAENHRLGYLGELFKDQGVVLEERIKTTTLLRKGVLTEKSRMVEYYIFNESMNITTQKKDDMLLFNFKNINGLRLSNFLN